MREDFKNALYRLRHSYKNDERLSWNERHLQFDSTFDDLVFSRAGGSCPVQATGVYQGQLFYFRYRWGFASLAVGGENPVTQPEYEASLSYGDQMYGFLTLGEFHDVFTKLLQSITRIRADKEHGE